QRTAAAGSEATQGLDAAVVQAPPGKGTQCHARPSVRRVAHAIHTLAIIWTRTLKTKSMKPSSIKALSCSGRLVASMNSLAMRDAMVLDCRNSDPDMSLLLPMT